MWVSRAPNGSSIRRISGSTTSVRISATRWRIPPDRVAGKASSNPSSPASADGLPDPSLALGRGTPRYARPSSTFWATVRQGKTVSFWKT